MADPPKLSREARRRPRASAAGDSAATAPDAASTAAILESISDGVFTVDDDWRITSFNRAAEAITGVPRDEAIGRPCCEVFRSDMCEHACALRETLASGRPVVGKTGFIIDAEGNRRPISLSTAVLRDATGRAIGGAETFRDLSELEALRGELAGRHRVGGMSSASPLMRRIFDALPAIAASASTVLVLGETGTGKERIARAIHDLSPRARGPFVAVNCGALPDSLLESELFGYRAGAFTGATRDKPGRFALARGGTIFLDEIGEVTPALQVRLLRVLQERVFEPLGGTGGEPSDARVICATNRDLAALMRQGLFREDLYYRIHVVRVELPPLRRRAEDIPALVDGFVARLNGAHGRTVRGATPEAMSLLMTHGWPGNIRELENAIERAFILCDGDEIGISHLPESLVPRDRETEGAGTLRDTRSLIDAQAIRSALAATAGDRGAAARRLGIHATTLFRRMKRLGIEPPATDGRTRRPEP